MNIIREDIVAPNEGWKAELNAGQILRITASSVIDFNAFARADRREFFDVARTRVYNLNIYPTQGHRLFSKQNNPMMRWLKDGFAGLGRHDLQCPHGCPDKMLETLAMGLPASDLPDPLGLFRNLDIAGDGALALAPLGPDAPVSIELEAEIDLICALVNCPDPATSAPGADATIAILAP